MVADFFASFFKGRLPHKGKIPPKFLDITRVCYITFHLCLMPRFTVEVN